MSLVNTLNDWDPLREVVVGTARGAVDAGFEPALSPYFQPGHDAAGETGARSVPLPLVDDAERQLDAFARRLERARHHGAAA